MVADQPHSFSSGRIDGARTDCEFFQRNAILRCDLRGLWIHLPSVSGKIFLDTGSPSCGLRAMLRNICRGIHRSSHTSDDLWSCKEKLNQSDLGFALSDSDGIGLVAHLFRHLGEY